MAFQGQAGQPAAMGAPAVAEVATVSGLTLLVLVLAKIGVTVPFYSRIPRDELLDNPTRRAVYEAIGEDPGSSLRELAEVADCSVSTVRYHLRRLADEDLVASASSQGTRRWFPADDFTPEEMNKLAVLSIGDTRDVYEAIRTEPGASLSELAETVGSSPSAVHKIVDRLLVANLVEKERDGRSVALHACD